MYCYDVNALYPFIMTYTPLPVGKPIPFTGDIRAIEPNAFGYFYCEITTPAYLEHPILQRRIKTSQGIRTIAGLGSWTGWIFSSEMDVARTRFGYSFRIIKGYEFQEGDAFSSYMLKMYDLRMRYPKGDPMNDNAKLLQNSLYGKFGMKSTATVVEIFDTSDPDQNELLLSMLDAYGLSVNDYLQIDNHIITVRDNISQYSYSEELDLFHGLDVNVAIASAVTAGGRMWMSNFKNNPNFTLYYSDTDSIFVVFLVDDALPESMIGNNIGQLKLESTIKKAVFLAPKVYAYITEDGKEVVKVKGVTQDVKSDIDFSTIENLLVKDSSRELTQEKWYKKTLEGEISVADVAYTLKATSNKRLPIYKDINGHEIFVGTKPYNYDNIIDHKDD
jgi:DNA polymerase type B, organellar and viral